MASMEKIQLSESTDGRGISVAANSTPGTTIHTGSSTATTVHSVYLYASNFNTTAETVVVEWGGVTEAGDAYATVVQPNETVLLVPGWLIQGNASTALIVKAHSTTASKVNIVGYVHEITA